MSTVQFCCTLNRTQYSLLMHLFERLILDKQESKVDRYVLEVLSTSRKAEEVFRYMEKELLK